MLYFRETDFFVDVWIGFFHQWVTQLMINIISIVAVTTAVWADGVRILPSECSSMHHCHHCLSLSCSDLYDRYFVLPSSINFDHHCSLSLSLKHTSPCQWYTYFSLLWICDPNTSCNVIEEVSSWLTLPIDVLVVLDLVVFSFTAIFLDRNGT